jgi:hypothetical protein
MVVQADQPVPSRFAVVSDGAFLFDDGEAVFFKEPDQLAEFHVLSPAFPAFRIPRLARSHKVRSKGWHSQETGVQQGAQPEGIRRQYSVLSTHPTRPAGTTQPSGYRQPPRSAPVPRPGRARPPSGGLPGGRSVLSTRYSVPRPPGCPQQLVGEPSRARRRQEPPFTGSARLSRPRRKARPNRRPPGHHRDTLTRQRPSILRTQYSVLSTQYSARPAATT